MPAAPRPAADRPASFKKFPRLNPPVHWIPSCDTAASFGDERAVCSHIDRSNATRTNGQPSCHFARASGLAVRAALTLLGQLREDRSSAGDDEVTV
jgi:hypothetical protein